MRIIIIGEYSGFSMNLCKGFIGLGHDCFVFSWGDSFKQIEPNMNTFLIRNTNYQFWGRTIKGSNVIRRFVSNIKLTKYVYKEYKHKKADVIIVINPTFLIIRKNILKPLFTKKMLYYMIENPENIYLSACGNDFIFNSYLPLRKKTNEYAIYKSFVHAGRMRLSFEYTMSYINKIIPTMYDYSEAYRYFKKDFHYKIEKTIPLPFDTASVKPTNRVTEKIKIMHGVSRPHEKGSYIIIEALNQLKKIYPDKVDIKVVWRVPLKEYLVIMAEANIVIDQCYGMGYGMNTIEALAMGKVVFSGNEKENQKEYGVSYSPIITIGPNADQILHELERFVLNKKLIVEYSEKSRLYAQNIHDSNVVAKQYLELFRKALVSQ